MYRGSKDQKKGKILAELKTILPRLDGADLDALAGRFGVKSKTMSGYLHEIGKRAVHCQDGIISVNRELLEADDGKRELGTFTKKDVVERIMRDGQIGAERLS